jgi:hypothetical protein
LFFGRFSIIRRAVGFSEARQGSCKWFDHLEYLLYIFGFLIRAPEEARSPTYSFVAPNWCSPQA